MVLNKKQDEVKGNEAKKKILVAATELFNQEGFQNVSMRKIASKIGYSPTNIYNYFENKDEILLYLLRDSYMSFYHYLTDACSDGNFTKEINKLRALIKAYIQFGLENPDKYKLIFINNIEQKDRIIIDKNDRMNGFLLLVDIVKEVIESNLTDKKDGLLVSQSIWASVHGITSLFISFNNFPWKEKEELINFHTEMIIKGILNKN